MNQEFDVGFKRPLFGDVPWVPEASLVWFRVPVEVFLLLADDDRPPTDPESAIVDGIFGQESRICCGQLYFEVFCNLSRLFS